MVVASGQLLQISSFLGEIQLERLEVLTSSQLYSILADDNWGSTFVSVCGGVFLFLVVVFVVVFFSDYPNILVSFR